uniref:LAM_G_DOMAIN domain-containing protein n=1 Tax=Macrostomum lignano TaxID=282301 RepID=A0A1I8HHR3_9PLAT
RHCLVLYVAGPQHELLQQHNGYEGQQFEEDEEGLDEEEAAVLARCPGSVVSSSPAGNRKVMLGPRPKPHRKAKNLLRASLEAQNSHRASIAASRAVQTSRMYFSRLSSRSLVNAVIVAAMAYVSIRLAYICTNTIDAMEPPDTSVVARMWCLCCLSKYSLTMRPTTLSTQELPMPWNRAQEFLPPRPILRATGRATIHYLDSPEKEPRLRTPALPDLPARHRSNSCRSSLARFPHPPQGPAWTQPQGYQGGNLSFRHRHLQRKIHNEECPFCFSDVENSEHFICECNAFTQGRLTYLGSNQDLSDVFWPGLPGYRASDNPPPGLSSGGGPRCGHRHHRISRRDTAAPATRDCQGSARDVVPLNSVRNCAIKTPNARRFPPRNMTFTAAQASTTQAQTGVLPPPPPPPPPPPAMRRMLRQLGHEASGLGAVHIVILEAHCPTDRYDAVFAAPNANVSSLYNGHGARLSYSTLQGVTVTENSDFLVLNPVEGRCFANLSECACGLYIRLLFKPLLGHQDLTLFAAGPRLGSVRLGLDSSNRLLAGVSDSDRDWLATGGSVAENEWGLAELDWHPLAGGLRLYLNSRLVGRDAAGSVRTGQPAAPGYGPYKAGWTLGLDRTVPHPPMIDTKKFVVYSLHVSAAERDKDRAEDSAGEPVRALVLPFESADGAWVPHPDLPGGGFQLNGSARLLPASFGRALRLPGRPDSLIRLPLPGADRPCLASAASCGRGFTLRAWLRPLALPGASAPLLSAPTFRLSAGAGGRLAVRFVDADTGEVWLASGGAAVSLNSWHLVEFAWQRGLGLRLWLNGSLAAAAADSAKKSVGKAGGGPTVLHVGGDPPAEGGAGGSSWPAFDLDELQLWEAGRRELTAAKLLVPPLRRCGVDDEAEAANFRLSREGFSVDLLLPASRGGVERPLLSTGGQPSLEVTLRAAGGLTVSVSLGKHLWRASIPASGLTSGRPANLTVSWQREAGLFVYLDNSLATAAYLARTLAEQPTANPLAGPSVAREVRSSLAWWNARYSHVLNRGLFDSFVAKDDKSSRKEAASPGAYQNQEPGSSGRVQSVRIGRDGQVVYSFSGIPSNLQQQLDLRFSTWQTDALLWYSNRHGNANVTIYLRDGLLHIEYKYIQDIGVDARHVMSGLITMRPKYILHDGRMHLLSVRKVDGRLRVTIDGDQVESHSVSQDNFWLVPDRGNVNLARHPDHTVTPAFSGEVGGAVVQAGGRSIDLLAELAKAPGRASVPFSMTGSVSVVYEPPPTPRPTLPPPPSPPPPARVEPGGGLTSPRDKVSFTVEGSELTMSSFDRLGRRIEIEFITNEPRGVLFYTGYDPSPMESSCFLVLEIFDGVLYFVAGPPTVPWVRDYRYRLSREGAPVNDMRPHVVRLWVEGREPAVMLDGERKNLGDMNLLRADWQFNTYTYVGYDTESRLPFLCWSRVKFSGCINYIRTGASTENSQWYYIQKERYSGKLVDVCFPLMQRATDARTSAPLKTVDGNEQYLVARFKKAGSNLHTYHDDITIRFKTQHPTGCLFKAMQNESRIFMEAYLQDGRPVIATNLHFSGTRHASASLTPQVLQMTSSNSRRYDDNKWHTLIVKRRANSLAFYIDDDTPGAELGKTELKVDSRDGFVWTTDAIEIAGCNLVTMPGPYNNFYGFEGSLQNFYWLTSRYLYDLFLPSKLYNLDERVKPPHLKPTAAPPTRPSPPEKLPSKFIVTFLGSHLYSRASGQTVQVRNSDQNGFTMELSFRTRASNGLLVLLDALMESGRYFGLELHRGRLRYTFSLQAGEATSDYVAYPHSLNDDRWHRVWLHIFTPHRYGRDSLRMYFAVDGMHVEGPQIVNSFFYQCNAYVAGVPDRLAARLSSMGFLSHADHRLSGCLASLIFYNQLRGEFRPLDERRLLDSQPSSSVLWGSACRLVSCADRPGYCMNGGVCRDGDSTGRLVCDCPSGVGGDRCELRPTCPAGHCGSRGTCDCQGRYPCSPRCICQTGWWGDRCEYRVACPTDFFCHNGGTCECDPGAPGPACSPRCRCPLGFVGDHCERRLQCDPGRCLNGGTCRCDPDALRRG